MTELGDFEKDVLDELSGDRNGSTHVEIGKLGDGREWPFIVITGPKIPGQPRQVVRLPWNQREPLSDYGYTGDWQPPENGEVEHE